MGRSELDTSVTVPLTPLGQYYTVSCEVSNTKGFFTEENTPPDFVRILLNIMENLVSGFAYQGFIQQENIKSLVFLELF